MDIEEQYDKIYRYCYFKLQHQQLAEDITQETFLKFYESNQYVEAGKTDEFLAEHDYSRQEVVDGLKYVVNYYGYGSLLGAFTEDIEL